MSLEGQLTIRLTTADYQVGRVQIQSSRPLQLANVFIGKTPEQLLQLLPLLFHVCGVAQSYAALTACQQALGIDEKPATILAREMLVNIETVREHCWQILLNLPEVLALNSDKSPAAGFVKLLNEIKAALFIDGNGFLLNSQVRVNRPALLALIAQLEQLLNQHIFSNQLAGFLKLQSTGDLQDWLNGTSGLVSLFLKLLLKQNWQTLGATNIRFLPELELDELNNCFTTENAEAFIQYPLWHGKTYETGVLARQSRQLLISQLLDEYGNSVLTRWLARLMELAIMPNLLRRHLTLLQSSNDLTTDTLQRDGIGLAQIQAARGLLIHRAELKLGIIKNYQILAPTEWNFHPQGIAANSLNTLTGHNEADLLQKARLVIQAIDPCVGFDLKGGFK